MRGLIALSARGFSTCARARQPLVCWCVSVLSLVLCACAPQAISGNRPAPALSRTYTSGSSESPDLRVTMQLDRLEMSPADRATLTIRVFAGAGLMLDTPSKADRLGDFTVAAFDSTDSSQSEALGGTERTLIYVLEPFLAGTKRIEPLKFSARAQGAKQPRGEITSEPITVLVRSLIAEQPPDRVLAKDPVSIAESDQARSIALVAIAVLGAGGYAGAFMAARLASRRHRVVQLDAARIARAELHAHASALLKHGDSSDQTRATSARCAETLRRFFETRFNVPIIARSSQEILRNAPSGEHGNMPSSIGERLAQTLQSLERLSFAPGTGSSGSSMQTVIDQCVSLIDDADTIKPASPAARRRGA